MEVTNPSAGACFYNATQSELAIGRRLSKLVHEPFLFNIFERNSMTTCDAADKVEYSASKGAISGGRETRRPRKGKRGGWF